MIIEQQTHNEFEAGQKTLTNEPQPLLEKSFRARHGIKMTALDSNSEPVIYTYGSDSAELAPGEFIELPLEDPTKLFLTGDGQGVKYIVV